MTLYAVLNVAMASRNRLRKPLASALESLFVIFCNNEQQQQQKTKKKKNNNNKTRRPRRRPTTRTGTRIRTSKPAKNVSPRADSKSDKPLHTGNKEHGMVHMIKGSRMQQFPKAKDISSC
ncbi:hypothetical protein MAR_027336 [Mya arenaria]|uniref:Uncharacterized protein n=1 Tax=Mya arenaria TaxID=6604 RepID=A0ABY7EWF2_MYAAR|nr:hypothetical protein MAR_027336 [Mya arenaria]